jgi:hypothetical protein
LTHVGIKELTEVEGKQFDEIEKNKRACLKTKAGNFQKTIVSMCCVYLEVKIIPGPIT